MQNDVCMLTDTYAGKTLSPKFLKWTWLSLNLDASIVANSDVCQKKKKNKKKNRMAKSVDPNEMACYKPSHLNVHCLLRFSFWSARLKGLACAYMLSDQGLCLSLDEKINCLDCAMCRLGFL